MQNSMHFTRICANKSFESVGGTGCGSSGQWEQEIKNKQYNLRNRGVTHGTINNIWRSGVRLTESNERRSLHFKYCPNPNYSACMRTGAHTHHTQDCKVVTDGSNQALSCILFGLCNTCKIV